MNNRKKYTKKEMKTHGWCISYYGRYIIDLKAPKGLTIDEHYNYLKQKVEFINSLCFKK